VIGTDDCARCFPAPIVLGVIVVLVALSVYWWRLVPEFWRGGTERVDRWEARASASRGTKAVPVLRSVVALSVGVPLVLVSLVPYLVQQLLVDAGRMPPEWLVAVGLTFALLSFVVGVVFSIIFRFALVRSGWPRWLVPPRFRS